MSKPPKGVIPPQLIPYKKGQSGNPSGRPKMSPDERKLVRMTKQEIARMLNMVADMTMDQMQERFRDPETKVLEKLFIKTLVDGLKGDSVKAAEFILTRTIGKPKESMDVSFIRHEVENVDGTKDVYTNEIE